MDLHNMRKEFGSQLDYQLELPENPFEAFNLWFKEAKKFYKEEANCFVLSTANKIGQVNSRVLLLKNFDETSFTFYTNYQSQKAKEIQENPFVACLFYWSSLEKQIRIQAKATKTSRENSEDYFFSRPRNSQIAAWSSEQSKKISSKKALVKNFNKYKEDFLKTEKIPCPEFWGGFTLDPYSFEFWEGGLYRLHDRVFYEKDLNKSLWTQTRLSP